HAEIGERDIRRRLIGQRTFDTFGQHVVRLLLVPPRREGDGGSIAVHGEDALTRDRLKEEPGNETLTERRVRRPWTRWYQFEGLGLVPGASWLGGDLVADQHHHVRQEQEHAQEHKRRHPARGV